MTCGVRMHSDFFFNGVQTCMHAHEHTLFIYSWASCWLGSIFCKRRCRGGCECSGGGGGRGCCGCGGGGGGVVVSAGQTNLCLALPGTIMQTGNYHFNAKSIWGTVVCRGGGHQKLRRGGKQPAVDKRRKITTQTKQRRSVGEDQQRAGGAAGPCLQTMDISGPGQRK